MLMRRLHIHQEATLVGHHGTGKITPSRESVKEQDSHLVKKEIHNDDVVIQTYPGQET